MLKTSFRTFVWHWRSLMSQRTATQVTCSDCGKETTVPFKPTPGKPVYCRECLAKHTKRPESRGKPSDTSKDQAWSRRRTNWK